MRHVRRRTLALSVAVLAALPAAAHAEDVTVTSFDGTKISAQFTPAAGLKPGQQAPVMLMTHGFGLTRETVESGSPALGQVGAPSFRKDGYSTLTWDSRGFGRSGGEVSLDSPQVDGRDVSALMDYLATRKDVQLDGPGDPRTGMHGASYGGGIAWATTVNDKRLDAISPAISWVSLTDALTRDARVKVGWARDPWAWGSRAPSPSVRSPRPGRSSGPSRRRSSTTRPRAWRPDSLLPRSRST